MSKLKVRLKCLLGHRWHYYTHINGRYDSDDKTVWHPPIFLFVCDRCVIQKKVESL